MKDMSFYTFRRATGIRPNPQEFASRANAAITGAANEGPTLLLVHRIPDGYATYFGVTDKAARTNKGLELAQAYGSTAVPVDELPEGIAQTPHFAKLVFRSAVHGLDTQYGADPAEMARALSQAMPDNSWVGFSVRHPKRAEVKNNKRYVEHRLGPGVRHLSKTKSAVVFSITVGAQTRADALSLAQSLPEMMTGFDIDTKAVSISNFNPVAAKRLAVAAAIATLAVVANTFIDALPEAVSRAGLIIAGIIALFGALGFYFTPKRGLQKLLAYGMLPPPSPPPAVVRKPQKEGVKLVRDSEGNMQERRIREFEGTYPLAKDAFLFESTVFAPAGNPHGSALAGAISASYREATPELMNSRGPIIGKTSRGENVPIPALALIYSLMIFGEPGSGKSVLLQGIWGWFAKERVQPSGLEHHPGDRSTLIAFETKGGGVDGYLSHSALHGDQAMLVDAVDINTPSIDIFDFGDLDMSQQAEQMVSAFKYAFDDGSIMGRSAESLRMVYHAALAAAHYDISNEDWMGDEESHRRFDSDTVTVHDYAHALLMGHTPEAFDAIMATLSTLADRFKRDGDLDAYYEIVEAVDSMSPLVQMTPSARRTHTDAPRNKIDLIRRMNYYTRPDRPTTTFREVLEDHRAVIINTGASDTSEHVIDEEQSKMLSGLMIYNLRSAIQRVCPNWEQEGRRVTIFSDEFSMLAGSNDEVLTWMRDRGRSFGVSMMFATQYPVQLSQEMRENVFGYYTVGTYAMKSTTSSDTVARELADDVTGEEIRNLKRYHLLMVTNVDSEVQPPVTVAVHNFNEDVDL